MSQSNKILLGLVLGVATGLFLGERATVFKWAADGFVKLLQMTVLPYVTISIISSLGSLSYEEAKTLGLRAGAVLLVLWAIALGFSFLFPLVFPNVESANFFSTTLIEQRPPFNFVDLYIPSNPFNSLANNIVPAVVLFSVVLGVALIGVEGKKALLDLLSVTGKAVARATRFIIRLTPYGLFAIAATTSGTLSLDQLGRLQVYLVTYVAIALLVSLWVLPGLVAALTPIRMGEIFDLTRNALLTAFVAGDLFIVLPILTEASKQLLSRHTSGDARTAGLPDTIVPASFNFPHTGKLLSMSFILFAGWFADAPVRLGDYPRLAVTGLVTFFGSLNSAVPFLLDMFRIPADTFQLFLATGVVNSRFGSLVAASHTVTVALLGSAAIAGLVRFQPRRLLRFSVVTVMLTVAVLGGVRVLFASVLQPTYDKGKVLTSMRLLGSPAQATISQTPLAAEPIVDGKSQLDAIRERGVLRVGYLRDALPYAYINDGGELVGLDVDLMHLLARELGLRIEFGPAGRFQQEGGLVSGVYDIIIGGVVVTTDRARYELFSTPYLDETMSLFVHDYDRGRFETWDEVRAIPDLRLVVPNVPYYIEKIRERMPNVRLEIVPDAPSIFTAVANGADAAVLPAERGSAWTLLHPEFSVVVPEPLVVKVPLAFPIGRADERFASFINTWIELKRREGAIDGLYRYWILGRSAEKKAPRWSVIRNVLHWVE
jgi:Na+/H+-dicarboxylate symporter/ABC-type amino acid transport substrate-binding protein